MQGRLVLRLIEGTGDTGTTSGLHGSESTCDVSTCVYMSVFDLNVVARHSGRDDQHPSRVPSEHCTGPGLNS